VAPLDAFDHVPTIRSIMKPCGLTATEVHYKFTGEGKFDYRFNVLVPIKSNSSVSIPIRWTMSCRSFNALCWKTSLLLENVRFDGIDYEQRVKDHRGFLGSGWHRHIWESALQHGDCECSTA